FGACFNEWLAYAGATAVLASAMAALTGPLAASITSPWTCYSDSVVEAKLIAAFLAALAAWNAALDKLADCQNRAGTGSGQPRVDDGYDDIERLVDEFIANASESWC